MTAAALFGARLLEFNFLPSRTLHPSRHAQYGAPGRPVPPRCEPAWHRHWSREILRRLGLLDRPVLEPDRPELALALLPPQRLARVARYAGATLCAPRLRRIIAGAEVRALADALGSDVLDFARRTAASLHPGLPALDLPAGPGAVEAIDRLGRAALRAALHGGGPELALRAELKLPDEPAGQAPCDAPAALSLGLGLLQHLEPTWHSSFPAMR